MAKAPTFAERKDHYRAQYSIMKVKPSRASSVDTAARRLLASRPRYEAAARQVGSIPWFVIAAIHMREASGSFAGVLHNGEKIIGTGRKTKLVPAGRGPFATWEAAAVDALKSHGLDLVTDWSLERICYELERYNGWGYWWRGDKSSAYLWAGTNIDGGGKFVADGVWSATTQDAQNGTMPIIQRLLQLAGEPDLLAPNPVAAAGAPTPAAKPAPASGIDPQRQVGGALNTIFKAIQAILKRKS